MDGDLAAAARALLRARATLGMVNSNVVREGFEGLMVPNLLDYLKEMEACGVPARSTGPRARAAARPHQSALSAGPQLYRQLWKDTAAGRISLVPLEMAAATKAQSSPFSAVEKLSLGRTVAEVRRIVHDQRAVNAWVGADAHPPAMQPRHRQLARLILHWRCS